MLLLLYIYTISQYRRLETRCGGRAVYLLSWGRLSKTQLCHMVVFIIIINYNTLQLHRYIIISNLGFSILCLASNSGNFILFYIEPNFPIFRTLFYPYLSKASSNQN